MFWAQQIPLSFLRMFSCDSSRHLVRTALASSPLSSTKNYRAMAAEADRIFLANRQQFAHSLLPAQTSLSPLGDTASTAAAVAARRQRDSGLCYYHSRFGAKAKQCRPPCIYGTQGNARAGTHWQL